MRHDPERDAAAYLAGELSTLRRIRFERHMLDCRACWSEANTAREGRILAESLREAAPASTRERIRAVADVPAESPVRQRARWPYVLAAATAVLVVLAAVVIPQVIERRQPAPLVAAAALLKSNALTLSREPVPAMKTIGAYGWRGTTQRDLAGIPATIYDYVAPEGRRLLVIASSQEFPRARNARDLDPAPSWLARVDEVSLLCADKHGLSWLAAATDDAAALRAGRALGLT
ncbi:zf-HC2 domain-containing protein [Nonomuraea sp. NBC_00507]|uniref:zf-HC2 domain-containing protein n=1 Tax=Nonomuraea sp. NBC_00507 TaxID=2976002 RepID=UPI002E1841F0